MVLLKIIALLLASFPAVCLSEIRLNHRIWALAWPLMLSNISIPLLGIVDTAILGHLEHARYLGAVSVGGSLMAMVLWTFSFLRTSTTGLTAQHKGAGQEAAIVQTLLRAALLGLCIALLAYALRAPLLQAGLAFVDASEEVGQLAFSYCSIRFLSLPAVLMSYCLTGWLIGVQKTTAVMLMVISSNVLNIVLDVVFVMHLGWNSDGAAWATVLAEYSACAIGAFVLLQHLRGKPSLLAGLSLRTLWDKAAMMRLLRMNSDLMLRTFCLLFCFLFFTAKGAQQSDEILAANAILLQLVLLSAFALDGFAHAAESLCGFAIGERRLDRFYATVKACLVWCLGTSLLITALLWAAQNLIVFHYSSLQAVQEQVQRYFFWLLSLPLAAVWCYLLDGVFIGAAQTRAMRDSMLACVLLVFIPLWFFTQGWGNHGLWFAFVVFNLARGLSLGGVFYYYKHHSRWLA